MDSVSTLIMGLLQVRLSSVEAHVLIATKLFRAENFVFMVVKAKPEAT